MNTFSRSLWWAVRPLWVWRLVRLLVRSLWLGALLALAGWLYSAATGRPLAWHEWALIGAGLVVTFFLAQALWPIPARRLALRLDRRFELKDQLAAAHEVAGRGPRNYVESDLLEAAGITFGEIRQHLLFRLHVPWNDLEMAVVVALAVVVAYYGLAALSLPPPPAIQHAAYEPLPAVGAEPVVQLPGVPAALQPAAPAQVGAGIDADEPASVAQAGGASGPSPKSIEEIGRIAEIAANLHREATPQGVAFLIWVPRLKKTFASGQFRFLFRLTNTLSFFKIRLLL